MAEKFVSSQAASLGGKVVDMLFGAAIKEVGYMWNCTEHVETFRHEAEKLKVMRGRVQEQIDISIKRGRKLSYGVEDWVKEAGTEISKAEEFLHQEDTAKKTSWVTLRRNGKSATTMARSIVRLQERGNAFDSCVFVKIPAPGPLDVYQNKDVINNIHTHISALGDIIKSLKDDSIQIIGIYGMGGVGKTTLAKEVVARVTNRHTVFAHVAFTTVSQKVDVKKIKKDIGEATRRIMKGDKILIILDDVWEQLNLEELRIPCGNNYNNCKILMTSRSEKVCRKMNAQSIICVHPLPVEEAWILFKHVVGEQVETEADLKPLADEVAKECCGLPLLIQAVGKALKGKSTHLWKAALSRLKTPAASEIDPDIQKAFTRLKLSYDYLKSEEAKSCFLLCSLFPEDTDISLEDLVRYAVGLQKFVHLDSIDDARDRVQIAVDTLTSSGLLMNSIWEGRTKMHDVVRDVALLIASHHGNNKFLVKANMGLVEWLPPRDTTSLKSYQGISLMDNHIINLPDYEVHLPQIQLFTICGNKDLSLISDTFIGCMKSVKVFDISWNNISSLPQSFQRLTKLRTLDLRENKSFHEVSILGELKDLEILILNGTGIAEIPKEIAQLVNLRVLEVNDCGDLSRIAHGVISALLKLEELCIEFKSNFNGAFNYIVEVMSLPKLAYLDLTVPSIDDIPAAECFNFENLKGFLIQIGKYDRSYDLNFVNMSRSFRYLILSTKHLKIPLVKWLKKVIEVSRPHIYLIGIENLKNIMPTLCNEGFNNLEHIKLSGCPNVSCILDDSISCNQDERKTPLKKYFMELKHLELYKLNTLEVIWKCPDEYMSLSNLVRLQIWDCDRLKRVFTVSVAQGLVKLKYLCIQNCVDIEEVIYGGGTGDIVFYSLTDIYLRILPRLKSFFKLASGNCSIIKYPYLKDVQIHDCVNMKLWGPAIHETPNLKTLYVNNDVQLELHGAIAINEAVEKSWRKYKDNQP